MMETDRSLGFQTNLFETMRERKPRNLKQEVSDCLNLYARGHERAMTERQIAKSVSINDPEVISTRIVRKFIRDLRLEGELIVSDTNGYWVPAGEEDKELVREYIGKLHDRGVKIFSLIKPQEMAFERKFSIELPLEGIETK